MVKLDELVRRLERKDYQPGNDSHYIYDPASDSFLDRLPRFLAGGLQFYQVICSSTGSPDAKGTLGPVGVKDPADGSTSRIELGYEAWIARENAHQVIRSVAGDNPGKQLEQLVITAVLQRAITAAATFFSRLPTRSADLARELEQRILAEHGLDIELEFQLLRDSTFEVHPLPRLDIDVPVHLKDYATELSVQLGVVLSVSARDQLRATQAMRRKPRLKEALLAVTREFFVEVELLRFRAELTRSLQQQLRERLEQEVAQWHLGLKTLSLTLQKPLPEVALFADEQSTFKIELRGHPSPVSLRTRVQLELTDEGRYHRAGAPPLKPWVEDTARRTVQQVLFHVRYSQLYADLAQWESQILEELRKAAKTIGYEVKAQITTPELTESRIQEFLAPFQLVISEEFATSVDHVRTGLELVLRLQLSHLRSVEAELDRGADLEKLFRDVVLDEAAAYLHTVSPGFLFTRFSPPVDHTGEPVPMPQGDRDKRRPVTAELKRRIAHALESRYGLVLLSFTVKQGRSAIRDSYLALTQAMAIPFQVKVPLLGHPEWPLHYGELQVQGVSDEGWSRFQAFQPTLEKVTTFVASATRDLLSEFLTRTGTLGFTEDQARKLIYVGLQERLKARIGLDTEIVAWYRDPSAREVAQSTAQLQALQEQLTDNLQVLREKRARAQERIAELRKQENLLLMKGKHAEAEKVRRQAEEESAIFGTEFGTSAADLNLGSLKASKKLMTDSPPSASTPPLPAGTNPDRDSQQ
ncbi:MAG TPA: hypothetical protein VNA24_30065 [Hyalangium sp.]|nr:hypothetical protein [Hyalangium sp.]